MARAMSTRCGRQTNEVRSPRRLHLLTDFTRENRLFQPAVSPAIATALR